jgi:hypothetical protein
MRDRLATKSMSEATGRSTTRTQQFPFVIFLCSVYTGRLLTTREICREEISI